MIQRVMLGLLLLGATVNLAAGARRPTVEHSILSRDHYAHADRAAQAVTKFLPAQAPLAVVVYDGDLVDELDAGVWFDYRSKWLLYPREIQVFRVAPEDPLQLRAAPGEPAPEGSSRAEYLTRPFVLFFRVTGPPTLPTADLEILSRDPMWVLARTRPEAAAHSSDQR